ncbi:MAG: hemolysin III family protein [Clostridiales bacterium]|nr:hemolysin III family protein [Clostridiales bacterium]
MENHVETKAQRRARLCKELLLPSYSLPEELISAITHGIGVGLSIAGLAVLLVFGHHDALTMASVFVFGVTMILLYLVSTLYHGLGVNRAKRVFRVLDHCTIFLLIAGTYTPISLVCFGGATGWLIFDIVWGVAVLGIILNAIDLKRFTKLSMACYIGLGWLVVFFFKPLLERLDSTSIVLLIAGGVIYTVGAVIYGVGKKVKYMHSLWHFFVMGGTIFHYFVIYRIVTK